MRQKGPPCLSKRTCLVLDDEMHDDFAKPHQNALVANLAQLDISNTKQLRCDMHIYH
ncbi:hypothetical protein IE4872_PC00205 (plasmid) [Rhizobium gallicum]|uniref:Uncharacterized protein n=1 Tax=Rhizobium gallicum TaxID=56730 RepID=A0A1L5NQQ2_9HYPH|nr:hypothetical protein IE4872_PC00205 [Rhizobium gallicum]